MHNYCCFDNVVLGSPVYIHSLLYLVISLVKLVSSFNATALTVVTLQVHLLPVHIVCVNIVILAIVFPGSPATRIALFQGIVVFMKAIAAPKTFSQQMPNFVVHRQILSVHS